jgi:hypothetical protein
MYFNARVAVGKMRQRMLWSAPWFAGHQSHPVVRGEGVRERLYQRRADRRAIGCAKFADAKIGRDRRRGRHRQARVAGVASPGGPSPRYRDFVSNGYWGDAPDGALPGNAPLWREWLLKSRR